MDAELRDHQGIAAVLADTARVQGDLEQVMNRLAEALTRVDRLASTAKVKARA